MGTCSTVIDAGKKLYESRRAQQSTALTLQLSSSQPVACSSNASELVITNAKTCTVWQATRHRRPSKAKALKITCQRKARDGKNVINQIRK